MSAASDMNKANTIRFFNKVFNEGDMAVVEAMISPGYRFNGQPSTAADTQTWAKGLRAQFPDLRFTIESILAEDANVALRWRMSATKEGVAGYITGTNILVIADGKAVTNDQAGGDTFIPLAAA